MQRGNTYYTGDLVNINDINKRFGRCAIDKLPLISTWGRLINARTMKTVDYRPLNYINYTREGALRELEDFCGFEYYGVKHLENYFTGFLQLYWLPEKFGVDKRTSHLSSMIVTNQISREEALNILKQPACTEEWLERAITMVKEKLDFSDEEFEAVMRAPTHQHSDYKTDKKYQVYLKLWSFIFPPNQNK